MNSSSMQRVGSMNASVGEVACVVVGMALAVSGSVAVREAPSSSVVWGATTLADVSASGSADTQTVASPWSVEASLVPLAWRKDVHRAADVVDHLLAQHFGDTAWSELRDDVDDGGVFYVVRTELPPEEAMRRFDELEAAFLASPPHPEMRVALSYV